MLLKLELAACKTGNPRDSKGGILTSDGKTLIIPNLNSRDIIFLIFLRDKVVSSIKVNGQPSAVAISDGTANIFMLQIRRIHSYYL